MKRTLIYIIGIAASLCTACENIDEDERFIEVEDVAAQRVVLLEDYTGQYCMNCPNAHAEATALHEDYPDNLIVVSMHAGGFGLPVAGGGLKQEVGDEYATSAGVETYPSGVVNRRSGVKDYPQWGALVREEVTRATNLDITVKAGLAEDGTLSVTTDLGALEALSGKLQLWVLEDSIVAIQRLPSGGFDREYLHNHVFRAAINGTWGEDVSLALGEEKTLTKTGVVLDDSWKKEHLSVVAFVYGGDGVIQAAQCKVGEEEEETEEVEE